ncbi:MAG: hypothetical protein SOT76_12710 [Eubacteriales bacterium]|nr:hypothetical protein [bacterium]MDY2793588.1 hypothetical protein [Eubacteriales bacterium]
MARHLKKHAGRHVVRTLIAFLLLVLLVGGVYYALLRRENSLTEKLVKAAATLTPEPTAQVTDTPAPTASPLPTDTPVLTDAPQSTQSVPVQPGATGEPTPVVNLTESPTQPATAAPTDTPTAEPTPEPTAEPEQVPAAEPVELDFPYYIEVDRGQHVVRVYTVDENGEYSILARTMICTTDLYANKPGDGLYRMDGQKIRWGSSLLGENQFQYATRICGKLLFHSINYSLQYPDMIKPESYATLGTAGSEGSVLLLAADAKWIYDNVPAGTPVRFLSTEPDSALLESLAAPALGKSGYDPTDPRDNNPDYDPSYEASKPEVTPYPGVTPAPTDGWEFRTYP